MLKLGTFTIRSSSSYQWWRWVASARTCTVFSFEATCPVYGHGGLKQNQIRNGDPSTRSSSTWMTINWNLQCAACITSDKLNVGFLLPNLFLVVNIFLAILHVNWVTIPSLPQFPCMWFQYPIDLFVFCQNTGVKCVSTVQSVRWKTRKTIFFLRHYVLGSGFHETAHVMGNVDYLFLGGLSGQIVKPRLIMRSRLICTSSACLCGFLPLHGRNFND